MVEAVLFYGRKIGHSPTGNASAWWGWLGVWPIAVALALVTLSVVCFPDGRLPSPSWKGVAVMIAVTTVLCATLSAIWPVEHVSRGEHCASRQ